MSFFNEVILKLGLSPDNCIGGDIVSIYDGAGALIEGHKGLSFIGKEQVTVRLKKGSIDIKGVNLKIEAVNADEVFITGKIISAERRG